VQLLIRFRDSGGRTIRSLLSITLAYILSDTYGTSFSDCGVPEGDRIIIPVVVVIVDDDG